MKKILAILIIITAFFGTTVYANELEYSGTVEFSADIPKLDAHMCQQDGVYSMTLFSSYGTATSDCCCPEYEVLRQEIEEFEKICRFETQIPYKIEDGERGYVKIGGIIVSVSDTVKSQIMNYIKNLYVDVLYENPELMHAVTYFEYKYSITDIDSDTVSCIVSLMPRYIITSREREAMLLEADKIIADTVEYTMTDEEKALALHDYIVSTSSYNTSLKSVNTDEDWYNFSAYNILRNNTGVCQGYTLAYNLLLHRVGIEARFVSNDEMNHGWSLVKLGDNWYHVDTTWDDPTNINQINHNCFLRSDDGIKAEGHTSWDNISVECSDNSYEALTYCFNGANVSNKVLKYKNGVFFTHRYLKLNSFYRLDSVYGIDKKYSSYYIIDDENYVKEYVKSKFDGTGLAIISEDEYTAAFEEKYDYKINLFMVNQDGVFSPVTLKNLADTRVFVDQKRECDYLPDVYIAYYTADDTLVSVEKYLSQTGDLSYSVCDTLDGVAQIRMFIWQEGAMTPVSECISIE